MKTKGSDLKLELILEGVAGKKPVAWKGKYLLTVSSYGES